MMDMYGKLAITNNNGNRRRVDEQGQRIISANCNSYHNVSVYCNADKLCTTKFVLVPLDGSKPTLIFDCNICKNEKNLIQKLKSKGKSHVSMSDIKNQIFSEFWYLMLVSPEKFFALKDILNLLLADNKMSVEIYNDFISWMDNSTAPQLGKNVKLNNFMVIEGQSLQDSDLVVPNVDTIQTCQNVNSSNKYYLGFKNKLHVGGKHFSISDDINTKDSIKEFLNNKKILRDSKNQKYIISVSPDCTK